MMPNTLEKSAQDKKDLERFSKFFTCKVVQVIVQSRLGEKIKCCSRPTSSASDWFNLSIDDNPEILKHTKAAISTNSLPSPPLLVEISLKTADSKTLPLELWNLNFQEYDVEQNIRILYTVYNRMSLLLKSLISVTRVVPAYKLSRMRGSDYQIHYNVFSGHPDYNSLGRECKIIKLGSVGTPFGSICLEFGYRTKMELSIESVPVLIKSDHYSIEDTSEGTGILIPGGGGNMQQVLLQKPVPVPKVPAFSDPLTLPSEEFDHDDIPFGNLLKRSVIKTSPIKKAPMPRVREEPEDLSNSTSIETDPNPVPGFEFISVKPPPFAPVADPSTDPATFFSTLQNPPPLQSLNRLGTPLHEIDKQMMGFEENVDLFDDFVKQLCADD